MHRKLCVVIAAWGLLAQHETVFAQTDYRVSSPDGSISIALQVGADQSPRYEVTRHGATVIAPSQLRLQLVETE